MMKKPRFLLLDEATTGLDTTRSVELGFFLFLFFFFFFFFPYFFFLHFLGTFCRIIADAYVPVVAALLQPPYKLLSILFLFVLAVPSNIFLIF